MNQDEQHPDDAPFPESRTASTPVRRLVLLAVLLFCLLALLSLPAGFPLHPLAGQLAGRFVAATATPDLPPTARELYLDLDAPWARVTLDGRSVGAPATTAQAPLVLSPGAHRLTWQAAPFPVQSCRLSFPASPSDTCDWATGAVGLGPLVPVMELGESFFDLPAAEQSGLRLAAQSSLEELTPATVQPGESYLTPVGTRMATTTIHADLTFQLQSEPGTFCQLDLFSTASEPCQLDGLDCSSFCGLPWNSQIGIRSAGGPMGWIVLAVVSLGWNFSFLDGIPIILGVPLDTGVAAINNHLVMLSVTWDGAGWHVLPILGEQLAASLPLLDDSLPVADNPACAAAQDLIYALGQQRSLPPNATLRTASDNNPSDGCLVTLGSLAYLVRFGTVIPLNQESRILAPLGPDAALSGPTASEQPLIHQLMGLRGQDFHSRRPHKPASLPT